MNRVVFFDLETAGDDQGRLYPVLEDQLMTIKLSCGVVDLSGLPDEIRLGTTVGTGEYRRVLDMASRSEWAWSNALRSSVGFVTVTRLEVSR